MSNEKYEKYKQYENNILDDRYIIDKLIGIGGMAVVFRARDTYLNNMTVAIKILKDDVATDEVVVKRFKNESKAEGMLKHNNIVAVHNVSIKGKIKYMVMEFLYGLTLKNYLTAKGEPLRFEEVVSYSAQILRALSEAHRNGIIHRDIKPQNIMLLENGRIKVMDFGIAKLPDAETITVTDKAVGTVYYMSPEQASGKKNIDTRSDIYSLGAMMYELATGQTPFRGETPLAVLIKHMQEEAIPPRQLNSSIPVGLEQIILCAMSKDPANRFQTADEMLSYLKRLQADRKIKFDELPSNSAMQNFWGKVKRFFSKKK
ncbi:MAG: serine/threonine protein kinase [Clostridia bacterium]|nr:serine/threonine protein kinase [Clostridia bacterium]MBR2944005.1 serine/threonine protein kinase [Clostridia bacterium]